MNTPGSSAGSGLVAGLGERGLIDRIRRRLPPAPPGLLVGPGDDAAVVVPGRGELMVLTTDALVEGIHFDFRYSSPTDIGYKALAVNLSDIAAMGATAKYALLSLILPDHSEIATVDGLLDGMLSLAADGGVTLAGGNISRSPGPLVVDVTVVGEVRPRKVLTRSGGTPGATLFVSGTIGAAAAGLRWLRDNGGGVPDDPALRECVERHRRPEPRTRLGALFGRTRAARACMDLSDGLADAVHQLAGASGTGARILAEAVPLHTGARELFGKAGADPIEEAIRGGEDYELLVAVPPKSGGRLRHVIRESRGVPLTRIGELTAAPGVVLVRGDVESPLPSGFAHF